MKKLFAILLACQLLYTGSLASVHMAADAHDPHESVHAHLGVNHDSGDSAEEQDANPHVHLCVLALNSGHDGSHPSPASWPSDFAPDLVNLVASPPVPPPTA